MLAFGGERNAVAEGGAYIMPSHAVVLLSGGLDSAVLLGMVARESPQATIHTLTFSYGQRNVWELGCAMDISHYYATRHHELGLRGILSGGLVEGTIQTRQYETEQEAIASDHQDIIVPFRNAVFISVGANFALSIGAEEVYLGIHLRNWHNGAFVDCKPEFVGAMTAAVYTGTSGRLRLLTPLQWMSKAEIVKMGDSIGVPFQFTRSCFATKIPCGSCRECIARKNAFAENALIDP